MSAWLNTLRRIPYWAYLLVFVVIFVNTTYLIYRDRIPIGGATVKVENGYYIHDYVKPGSSVFEGGIRSGDTLVSMNSIPVEKWEQSLRVGDTIVAGVLRQNKEVGMTVIVGSLQSFAPGFFWSIYFIIVLCSVGSLYILYKKGNDTSVILFFIIIQLFMIMVNGLNLNQKDPVAFFANMAFFSSSCFLGPTLIHFHLLFPRPAKVFNRYKRLPVIFYAMGFILFTGYSTTYFYSLSPGNTVGGYYSLFERIVLGWITLTFSLALAIVIFQFKTIRDTLARNQLRIVIIGTFFGLITPMAISLFYSSFIQLSAKYPIMTPVSQSAGTLILVCCILIAIYRYRIWDMEFIIRRALLYLGATAVIVATYLFLIWIVNRFFIRETDLVRFAILAVSVILFLVLRDRLQRLIDHIFHREEYDSATVVSDFEAKLEGIYDPDALKQRIVKCIDEIFHVNSFFFHLKRDGLIYEPAIAFDAGQSFRGSVFKVTPEMEEWLQKAKVFSPEELNDKIPILAGSEAELIIPLISEGQPCGFFLCGKKLSERIYSRQDIQVLKLLGQRVVSLLHTAGLYQKDLDRQLMLERERTRISQDMHDDVGASLTRITMMSDLLKGRPDMGEGAGEWLGKISETSRGLTEEMSQIIWALNPRNDTIESLVTHIRRYAMEYLEPTSVECMFDLPADLPDLALTVEVRRNIYLVVREALHNVVKHSGATRLRIKLEMMNNGFSIRIKDDGIGFDPGRLEFRGNGLINMKKRIHHIGGEFYLHSHPGEGTEIILVVPVT